jgi:CRISPR-associated protein Cst2
MPTPIYSLSIAARATLDMHSLNNEGGEGNQIQTRMVDIVDASGRLHNVNAISGDMIKHILAGHFFNLARERGLPLCAGCRKFDANRINADADFQARIEPKTVTDAQALDWMLETCAMDDIAGILVTAKGRSLPRKSVIDFGWVLGLPETADANNQSFFHVKYASGRSEAEREEAKAERVKTVDRGKETQTKTGGANLQQAIFHRPANSGIYAVVCNVELSRIGYNEIRQEYALAVSAEQRILRAATLIESLLHTFVQLNGAMRSTQLPHLVSFEGVLSYSTKVVPAPLVSPLADTYDDQIRDVAQALGFGDDQILSFADLGAFANRMRDLLNDLQPYQVAFK